MALLWRDHTPKYQHSSDLRHRDFVSQNSIGDNQDWDKSAASQNEQVCKEAIQRWNITNVNFPAATHKLNALPEEEGAEVVLHGYVGRRADVSTRLAFVQLVSQDLKYSLQIKTTAHNDDGAESACYTGLKDLREHTPIAIRGTLVPRPASRTSKSELTPVTHVELEPVAVYPLNTFPDDIIMKADTRFPPEQRHLQLRSDRALRDALTFRADATHHCRDQLRQEGFVEIDTPLLFKSTPEGAREFLVPTRETGRAYALPQSPQQYKQVLMASGIPRYFQFARCFRDEDLRADRQPEFTQLDLEMSFATGEDVMLCIESLLRRLWRNLMGVDDLPSSFPRMTYEEAMSRYGSDKPDLRLGMEITRLEHLLPVDLIQKIGPLSDPIVEAIKLHVSDDPAEIRDFVMRFMDSPDAAPFLNNPEGQPGIFIVDSTKPLSGLQPLGFEAAEQAEELLSLADGDLLVLQARARAPFTGGATPLGTLRLALHRAAVAGGHLPASAGHAFCWITTFPLFTPSTSSEPGQGGAAGLSSTHHPFTAPLTPADVDLLVTDPARARAEHYDIVLNGVELGGGSRRIHDARVQELVLRDVLRMPEARLEDFRGLLQALRAGCPPHAGIALGLDRLVATMLGRESVRDVMAFPKGGRGEDGLVGAPGRWTEEQLETYHLRLRE